MIVNIKKLDGQKSEFNIESTDAVTKLKEQLSEKVGINKDQIRLIHKGKPMTDDKTFGDQNVQPGATIHMIMQMRGG
jgi:ubiquitin-like protein Nedd8